MHELYPVETESRGGLLVRLAEECAEVVKAVAKAQRFGLENYHPADPEKVSNAEAITVELADVWAIADELRRRGMIP